MKFRIKTTNLPEIVRLWRVMPVPYPVKKGKKEVPVVSSMRGNVKSRILLIAPPLTDEEYTNGLPLTSRNAIVFHGLLEEHAEFDTNEDCVVISCSRWGEKPNKASTQDIRDLLARILTLKKFTHYVCIGDDAFKHTFGRGKKPPMHALQGNVLYLPECDYRPMFIFPSVTGLHVEETGDFRTDRRLFEWQEKTRMTFTNLILEKFVPFLSLNYTKE